MQQRCTHCPATRNHHEKVPALILAVALAATALVAPAITRAAEILPITQENVQAAVAGSKPILYHVHATWCPVCAKQNEVLDSILTDPAFDRYVVLKVDFDKNKRAVEMLGAKTQSTLIVAKGAEEVGRAAGITDSAQIRALLLKAGS